MGGQEAINRWGLNTIIPQVSLQDFEILKYRPGKIEKLCKDKTMKMTVELS